MIGHHVYTVLALAHKQAQMEAARQAEQARLHRRRAGRHDAGRSLPGWILHRLRHCWSRVPGQRPRSAAKRRFTALVSADNAAMAGLLRNMGAEPAGRGPGTVEYEMTLAPGASATTSMT